MRRGNQLTHPWMEPLARFGMATKGVLYLIIGILAAMAAFGAGGQVEGGQGALHTIAAQPFGKFLLIALGIGLAGYALWRFTEAAFSNRKESYKRVGYAASGVIYGALAVACYRIVTASGGGGQGSQQGFIAEVLSWPGGQTLAVIAGIAVVLAGLYQLYKAATDKFKDKLKTHEMSRSERTWVTWLGRAGLAARGVVFPIIGWGIIQAGLQYQPGKAEGTGGALRELASETYGMILLGIVAIGLAMYGAYQVAAAKYRRIAV